MEVQKYIKQKYLGRGIYENRLDTFFIEEDFKFKSLKEVEEFLNKLGWCVKAQEKTFYVYECYNPSSQEQGYHGNITTKAQYNEVQRKEIVYIVFFEKGNAAQYIITSHLETIIIKPISEKRENFGKDCINSNKLFKENQNTMQTLDISLQNADLYKGCEIEEVAGRLNLTTPISEAVNIVGRNISEMNLTGDQITLTGAMAVWAYLIVFHAVVHRFTKVWYNDGRNEAVLLAAHG